MVNVLPEGPCQAGSQKAIAASDIDPSRNFRFLKARDHFFCIFVFLAH